jgi:hypothetical protein
MVISGRMLDAGATPGLTRDYLALKRRYFPRRFNTGLARDDVPHELKGNEVLQMTRSDSRDKRRQAWRIRHALLDLVQRYDGKVVGRIWVKRPGKRLKPGATYCYAAQDIAKHFSQYLIEQSSTGDALVKKWTPPSELAGSRCEYSLRATRHLLERH